MLKIKNIYPVNTNKGFPDKAGKDSTCNAGDPSSIPGSGRSTGEGIDYPLQYSGLENSMNRGAWWSIVHGVAKNRTRTSDFHTHTKANKK